MRLITIQDKYVLEELYKKNKPIYECQVVAFKKREELLYNKMKIKMIKDLGIQSGRNFVPIWCWVVPKSQEITGDYIDELYDRMAPKCDRIVYFELDVPKELIVISNFERWSDLLFNTAFGKEVTDEDFNKLFEKQKGAILQACIPFIARDHILSYKDYNDFGKRDYSVTESMISDAISKGAIQLDPTGQFILSEKEVD